MSTPIDVKPGKYVIVQRAGQVSKSLTWQDRIYLKPGESVEIVNGAAVPVPDPVPPLPPPPPPISGVPSIPAGKGTKLRKDFADGLLAPFVKQRYPDDHIGGAGQYMTQYCRYTPALTDPTLISVHDGFLDLGCKKRPDNLYNGSFVATFTPGKNAAGQPAPDSTFAVQYPKVRWCARFPGATGRADWRTLWLLIGDAWGAPEPDWPEIIGGKATANLHGSGADGQKASVPFDTAWHVWGVDVYPTRIDFLLDGVVKGSAPVAMTAKLALLADAKVGLAAPDSTTPAELRVNVAWVTVD